nr:hypothetical protein [Apis mellifera nudivirus]
MSIFGLVLAVGVVFINSGQCVYINPYNDLTIIPLYVISMETHNLNLHVNSRYEDDSIKVPQNCIMRVNAAFDVRSPTCNMDSRNAVDLDLPRNRYIQYIHKRQLGSKIIISFYTKIGRVLIAYENGQEYTDCVVYQSLRTPNANTNKMYDLDTLANCSSIILRRPSIRQLLETSNIVSTTTTTVASTSVRVPQFTTRQSVPMTSSPVPQMPRHVPFSTTDVKVNSAVENDDDLSGIDGGSMETDVTKFSDIIFCKLSRQISEIYNLLRLHTCLVSLILALLLTYFSIIAIRRIIKYLHKRRYERNTEHLIRELSRDNATKRCTNNDEPNKPHAMKNSSRPSSEQSYINTSNRVNNTEYHDNHYINNMQDYFTNEQQQQQEQQLKNVRFNGVQVMPPQYPPKPQRQEIPLYDNVPSETSDLLPSSSNSIVSEYDVPNKNI